MNNELLIKISEAIIFMSEKPITINELKHRLPDNIDINNIINMLLEKYKVGGFILEKSGDSLAFRTSSSISNYLKIEKTIQKKLSKAALEILASRVDHCVAVTVSPAETAEIVFDWP